MPDSFATLEDLAAFLNTTFDGGQDAQAQLMLDGSTAAIRAEAGQTISLVENDEVVLAGTWDFDLELPEWPVVDVTAVAVNGVPVHSAADYDWNSRQLLRRTRVLAEITGAGFFQHAPGAVLGYPGHWGGPGSTVAVTYSHGYETTPADLKLICLQAAARVMLNPSGVRSESLGAYSVGYATRADGGVSVLLNDDEKRLIRTRYRH